MQHLRMAVWAVFCAAFSAFPALADKLSLDEISNYFNGLKTAQSRFTQVNDDGTTSSGTLYISRPGKMRFEYDPPEQALVLASANAVVIIDKKSNQPPETYPLSKTPLSLILARQVNLKQARMVTGHDYDGTATIVTAQDPKNSEYGTIQMSFTDAPTQLRQWVINDANGGQTTVVLGAFETGMSLRNTLFDPGVALQHRDR
ncbi:Outer-membrane lipoprotein carrier protein [Roseobacter fucihabitans]|uniref:Outer-membrane lipoprotein carrier protein n=1 Tax=Roseobacter fucihabitans TaxID=1537242 RepID=A0ABZ2BX41_9RHOB|nr:outer membrane lipoprotein carrier protein LolA [Roseobacter litoralis]MBC6967660.1 Outer-membrane lipoprotein carrier protein precursor [Roseobacter litoralis]